MIIAPKIVENKKNVKHSRLKNRKISDKQNAANIFIMNSFTFVWIVVKLFALNVFLEDNIMNIAISLLVKFWKDNCQIF